MIYPLVVGAFRAAVGVGRLTVKSAKGARGLLSGLGKAFKNTKKLGRSLTRSVGRSRRRTMMALRAANTVKNGLETIGNVKDKIASANLNSQDKQIEKLEAENQRLRLERAQAENAQLKESSIFTKEGTPSSGGTEVIEVKITTK